MQEMQVKDTTAEPDIAEVVNKTGEAIMTMFFDKISGPLAMDYRKHLRETTGHDSEMVSEAMTQFLDSCREEFVTKANCISSLIVGLLVQGRMEEIRSFEALLVDLIKRHFGPPTK
jgi:hypothetical protein